ncbi:MAG: rhomboid family intramembrane serine protease [Chitinispirillaceae bacterium]|nr:rhomboid family intramembrane serine protease [Chitinispirillaceae bacterium]
MNGYTRRQITPAVKWLLIVNVVVYVLELIPGFGRFVLNSGTLVPVQTFAQGQLWRVVTYMFLHDQRAPFHLLFNMLALWMFAQEIETVWGTRRFLHFYFIAGIGSGCFSLFHLFSTVMKWTGVIGASGAILALLTVYAAWYPHRKVLLFFILPVNIRIVVIGYALFSLFGTLAPYGMVSHITHLGGILVAIAYLKLYPLISERSRVHSELRSERNMRRNAEKAIAKKRLYEERIDPILEKISREGMDALSTEERRILKKMAGSKDREYLKKKKIVPFDLFR